MANDAQAFIQSVESKFTQHRDLPREAFLRHFQPREFHFYLKIIAELKGRYRPQAPFRAMMRKFPVQHWQEAIRELLERFNKKREPDPARSGIENGISLVKAACAAFPEFFADDLDKLFVARIDFPGYLTAYMWQQFGQGYKDFLRVFVDANSDDSDAQCRGLSYALITGDPELERWAKDYIRHELDIPRKMIEGLNITAEMLNQHLMCQGLEWRGNDVRRLYPNQVLHLVFPYRYLKGDMNHETFMKQDPLPGTRTFGGAVVATNTNGKRIRVQHFMHLEPVPSFLPVTGLPRLLLGADMDEVLLTPGATYQKHLPDGSIHLLEPPAEEVPDWMSEPIPGEEPPPKPEDTRTQQATPFIRSAKVLLSRQGPAWFFQRLPLHAGSNFYRLGGPPSFLTDANFPSCVSCGKTMHFLMQLDSTLPLADGSTLEWGKGGMAYIYWCDSCKVSAVNYMTE